MVWRLSAALRRRWTLTAGVVVLSLVTGAVAERRLGNQPGREPDLHNIPYDGRFAFARVQYVTAPGGWYY